VAADGAISVPYAGRVRVAGRTPLQVQNTIEQRLAQQVAQPQVIVVVRKTVSNSVTVSGGDVTGERVPLSMGGDRLLDVIASAGGAKSPVYDTSILISRHGRTATIPMTTVVSDPQDNIYVWPGDVITVEREPNTFSVFGATTDNNQVPFGAARLDLAEAIAKARGLSDFRADPEGVFLFRFEPPAVVYALGVPDLANRPAGETPVLYHLNLRQVDGYFLAERVAVENHDLIYVANAPLTVTQKFFTLIGSVLAPATTAAAAR
jgi:polysaccharide biosynthesis/export protein